MGIKKYSYCDSGKWQLFFQGPNTCVDILQSSVLRENTKDFFSLKPLCDQCFEKDIPLLKQLSVDYGVEVVAINFETMQIIVYRNGKEILNNVPEYYQDRPYATS